MRIVNLVDKPRYTAVSYVWGDEIDMQLITVNGHHVLIRRNLFDFLEVFRSRKGSDDTFLWIDQICINQQCDLEKSSQIAMMEHIYRGACETLVWLGPDPHNGLAFEAIQRAPAIASQLDEVADN